MNILRSFTETVVTTPTELFPISFEYDEKYDAVHVFLNDVAVEELGYTVSHINSVTLKLEPAVPEGVVRIERETDIDKMMYIFDAGALFIEQNVDADFKQLVHSQQEVRDGFIKLRGDVLPLVDGLEEALKTAREASEAATDAANAAEEAAAIATANLKGTLFTVDCIEDLLNLDKWVGRTVFVRSYERPVLGSAFPFKGEGIFTYTGKDIDKTDYGVHIYGWERQVHNNVLTPLMFGAQADLVFGTNEVLVPVAGTDDTLAFQRMLNMNSYVIHTNISKAVSSRKYSKYTFSIPHGSYWITDTLPLRTNTSILGNNSTLYFSPPTDKDLFAPLRSEMAAAYTQSTGWNTQTISMVRVQDLVIIGNLTKYVKPTARKAFDAGNAYKWYLNNILIERFYNGISIYPMDTSEWTGGSRIGNCYENVLNNLTVHECVQGVFNGGNVTQATNLTIGGGYLVGAGSVNAFDYLLINLGAGFSCNGFNIAPSWDNITTKPLILDGCNGSYYSGGYSEWFNPYFELMMPDRLGGFKLDASHLFKYQNHCLIKFQEGTFSKYDYATGTRTVPTRFKDGRKWNQYLNSTGYGVGAGAELLTNFFKYTPQYDFKYGMYGVAGDVDKVIYDVKRFEDVDTGFTTKYGIRLINPTSSELNLYFPLEANITAAKVCVLYRPIANFDATQIKTNVLGFNGTNDRISTGELMVDYGNGWYLGIAETTSELTGQGNFTISLPAGCQVEIEHIGAYANGWPIFPTYTTYEPKVNSYADDHTTDTISGGAFAKGDITRAVYLGIVGSVQDTLVKEGGLYNSRLYNDSGVTLNSTTDYVDFSSHANLKYVGSGVAINVQQSGVLKDYVVAGRKFSGGSFSLGNVKLNGISSGQVFLYEAAVKAPQFVDLAETVHPYYMRSLPYSGTIPANGVLTTPSIEVKGAKNGDTVVCSVSPALGPETMIVGSVVGANTVNVYHRNFTNTDFNIPASTILTVKII